MGAFGICSSVMIWSTTLEKKTTIKIFLIFKHCYFPLTIADFFLFDESQ